MNHLFQFIADTTSKAPAAPPSDIGAGAAAAGGALPALSVTGIFGTVANVLIYLVGAISVIVLIIGGLRYVVSGGNPAQVQGAKNTILYAIVGIVVTLAAFAIVSFVLTQFKVT